MDLQMLLISHCECGSKSRSLFLSWIVLIANWTDAWMRILLSAVSLDSCIIYWILILTNFEKKLNSFKSHTQTISRQLFQKRSFTFASTSRAVAWKFLVTSALNFTGTEHWAQPAGRVSESGKCTSYVFVFDGEQLLRRAIVFCIEKDQECSPVENAGQET